MVYSIKGLALLALALGMGYMVFLAASKERGALRILGYIVGVLIITACLIGALLRLYTGGGPICVV